MSVDIKILTGGRHVDNRGTLDYFNEFDMSLVKRMYLISHPDCSIRRGWRGHKIEQRWFLIIQGCFEISVVKIDNFERPNPNLELSTYILSAENSQLMHVPVGFASAFKALEPNSKFMVYADSNISDSGLDDYLYPVDYFNNWK